MRELNAYEVDAVAGGGFLGVSYAGAIGRITREIGIGVAVQGAINAVDAAWTWATTPSEPTTYGNGNGATGPGYSGAGIGGSVSEGSSGSSHFG